VSLKTAIPDAKKIAQVLKSHLASVSSWREEELEIRSIPNLDSIVVPEGEIELRVTGTSVPANFGNALIPLEVIFEGKVFRTFWVKADVRIRAQVLQLTRPVGFGRALREEDLRVVRSDIENPRATYLRDPSGAAGLTARRPLSTGELLKQDMLNENFLVQSGETVRLSMESGTFRVAILAHALQNGRLGDRIKVRNTDSNRAITVVVTGRGEVKVAR
jgi:flagella basal body P-ring formation protein FlgA